VHKSSDIYSFGLLLTILFDREFQQRSKAKNSLTSSVREGQASDKWIDSLSELIKKMSIRAPALRISISEVEAFFN
jgi:serine/threonine protein kinase